MKTIELDHYPEPISEPGVHAYIADFDSDRFYGKRNTKYPLGLKIFKHQFKPLDSFMWKDKTLKDCTTIQNIFWMHSLAPRVLDLVKLITPKGKHWAQVTEILPDSERGERVKGVAKRAHKIMSDNHIGRTSIDPNQRHKYKHYFVDFSCFHFSDKKRYEDELKERVITDAGWGSNPKTYQTVEELGLEGQRKLAKRLKAYNFDEIDFKGKTVLDYGCSNGQVARDCVDRGAKRVIGLELPKAAKVAFELSNYLGYYSIDYYGGNFSHKGKRTEKVREMIEEESGRDNFDIVLYLSVQQLGWPEYIEAITNEYFFLEGHSGDHKWTYDDKLAEHFTNVVHLGPSRDHSVRPCFRCSN